MPDVHDARERADICKDCWFWREMSCALANPEAGICANRRPVRGRHATPIQPPQAQLVPLAHGHAVAASAPFAQDAPESTFSLAHVRESVGQEPRTEHERDSHEVPARIRSIPSAREIRAGRAAAAARVPAAEVRISVDRIDQQLQLDAAPVAQHVLPGMDDLVERVRRRTAARISQAGPAARA